MSVFLSTWLELLKNIIFFQHTSNPERGFENYNREGKYSLEASVQTYPPIQVQVFRYDFIFDFHESYFTTC